MKLYEAALKMNPGDIFRANDVNVNDIKLDSDGNSFNSVAKSGRGALVMFSKEYLQLQGEIIRAEPKILTPSQYVHGLVRRFGSSSAEAYAVQGFEDGTKNGQVKEWKRMKPLIDAAKCTEGAEVTSHRVFEAVKNLTPPWEPEK